MARWAAIFGRKESENGGFERSNPVKLALRKPSLLTQSRSWSVRPRAKNWHLVFSTVCKSPTLEAEVASKATLHAGWSTPASPSLRALLFDTDFCNVATGWEQGVVKNVQDSRRRIWIEAGKRRFGSFTELNAWLAPRCRALWDEVRHPEHGQFSVAEMLEHETASPDARRRKIALSEERRRAGIILHGIKAIVGDWAGNSLPVRNTSPAIRSYRITCGADEPMKRML